MKPRLAPRLKAKELTNNIYQPLGYLNCHVSSGEMWEYSKERAREHVKLLLEELPMYTGELNPNWKYYNDVLTELNTMP